MLSRRNALELFSGDNIGNGIHNRFLVPSEIPFCCLVPSIDILTLEMDSSFIRPLVGHFTSNELVLVQALVECRCTCSLIERFVTQVNKVDPSLSSKRRVSVSSVVRVGCEFIFLCGIEVGV